jgi:hypothetical protein
VPGNFAVKEARSWGNFSSRRQVVHNYGQEESASFAACSQLFRLYPLAVTQHSGDGGMRSMVLMNRTVRPAGFFVLTQASDGLFVIRAWNGRHEVSWEIRPEEPDSGVIHKAVTDSMPVFRDGALLGWVTDSRVTAVLAVDCRQPEPWDAPAAVPEIRVMPMAGTSELLHWPPFSADPLADGRLWDYVERGLIVDIVPLVTRRAGRAFWAPSPDKRSTRHEKGCVVITNYLTADEYRLPAGIYLDHWTLREGIEPPPSRCLLALPGVVDLAHSLRLRPGRVKQAGYHDGARQRPPPVRPPVTAATSLRSAAAPGCGI